MLFTSRRVSAKRQVKKARRQIPHTERQTGPLVKDRPALARRVGFVTASLLLFAFLIWQILQIIAPVEIIVVSPEIDQVVQEPELKLSGQVEPGSILTVNGASLVTTDDGSFELEAYLQPGLNTFTFEVRKRYSKARTVTRHVYLDTMID